MNERETEMILIPVFHLFILKVYLDFNYRADSMPDLSVVLRRSSRSILQFTCTLQYVIMSLGHGIDRHGTPTQPVGMFVSF